MRICSSSQPRRIPMSLSGAKPSGSSASRFWLTGCVAVHDLGEAVVVVRGLDEHRVVIAGSRRRAGNGRIVEQDRKLHGGEELAFGAVFQRRNARRIALEETVIGVRPARRSRSAGSGRRRGSRHRRTAQAEPLNDASRIRPSFSASCRWRRQ